MLTKNKYFITSNLIYLFFLVVFWNCRTFSDKDLEIKQSLVPKAGNGVFAKKDIPEGILLGYYEGKMITDDEYTLLYHADKWQYVMGLLDCALPSAKGHPFIDGTNGNIFTRINYAPKEYWNVKFVKLCEPPYAEVRTIRSIKKGEELYIDYGPNYDYHFMETPEVKSHFQNRQ